MLLKARSQTVIMSQSLHLRDLFHLKDLVMLALMGHAVHLLPDQVVRRKMSALRAMRTQQANKSWMRQQAFGGQSQHMSRWMRVHMDMNMNVNMVMIMNMMEMAT